MIIKGQVFLIIHALWSHLARNSSGFTSPLLGRGRFRVSPLESSANVDLSIDYDAAAKLAYQEWREKYGKGSFDNEKYSKFRANYEAITIANVIALKQARDSGITDDVDTMELNEFADMTEDEFNAMQSQQKPNTDETSGSLLGTAMASSAAQSEAAAAIEEAAAALAVEEQKLVEQLGLASVEELEVALDSIEGIAEDGGELDSTNISREARIRSAYLEWCRKYGKTPDESRYPTFSSNFLAMEKYARENSKDMVLNKYADCTEAEYNMMTGKSASKPVESTSSDVIAPELSKEKKAAEVTAKKVVGKVKPMEESVKEKDVAESKKKTEEVAAKKVEITEKKRDVALDKAAVDAKARAETEAVATAKAADMEKKRRQREAELEKAAADAKARAEAEAIATAKATAEKEAAQIARRRQVEAEAADLVRKQAKEFEARISAPPSLPPVIADEPVISVVEEKGAVESKKQTEEVAAEKVETVIVETVKGVAESKKKTEGVAAGIPSFLAPIYSSMVSKTSKSESKKKEEAQSPALAPPVISQKIDTLSSDFDVADPVSEAFASFFGTKVSKSGSSSKPVESLTDVEPIPAKKDERTIPFFQSKFSVSQAKTEAVPLPVSKKEPASKKLETPPIPVVSKEPMFSFFKSKPSSSVKKVEVDIVPPPVTKKEPSFPLFNTKSQKTASKIEVDTTPATIAKKESSFSFFSSKPVSSTKTVSEPIAPAQIPAPKKESIFSFFTDKTKASSDVKKVAADASSSSPTSRSSGTISLKPSSGTISLKPLLKSTAPSSAANDIPIIKGWKRERDGSITGTVSNSKVFRNGETITTSPVRGPVEAGSVVETISGSKYRLDAPISSPTSRSSGTISLKPSSGTISLKPSSGTISLKPLLKSTAPSSAANDIPVLKDWKRERDGSITGTVSNSKKFRNGETITTSPIRGLVKAGSVVETISGSKYRLM